MAWDYFDNGAGSDDIYWYDPGYGVDPGWDFHHGARRRLYDMDDRANGRDDEGYAALSGDFHGDGREDIVFIAAGEQFPWFYFYDATPAAEQYDRLCGAVVGTLECGSTPRPPVLGP